MRNMIGRKVDIYVQDEGQVEGEMVGDEKSFILIRLEDDRIKRVVKSKICSFIPEGEDIDYVPFHVLFCENKLTGCTGVQFIQEGEGVARADFEKFMGKCPCRDDCGFGTKGELRSVNGEYLKDMFANTMFGSYPEKKEKEEENKDG